MRQGGARTLINDLISQVQALANIVQAGQSNTTMPEMMAAMNAAELQKLDDVKAALAQLHADMTAPDSLLPYVDGLEGLITATNAKLDALAGFTDGLETLQSAANVLLSALRDSLAPPVQWNAMADSGALILATTAKVLKAAGGTGQRHRVKSLQIRNANLLTDATVHIMDDTAVIWSMPVAAGQTIGLPVDLIGSANKALNVKLAAAITTGVAINAQGYTAA